MLVVLTGYAFIVYGVCKATNFNGSSDCTSFSAVIWPGATGTVVNSVQQLRVACSDINAVGQAGQAASAVGLTGSAGVRGLLVGPNQLPQPSQRPGELGGVR